AAGLPAQCGGSPHLPRRWDTHGVYRGIRDGGEANMLREEESVSRGDSIRLTRPAISRKNIVSTTDRMAPTLPSRVLLRARLRDSPRLPVLRPDNFYLRRASMDRHAQTTALSRRTFLA